MDPVNPGYAELHARTAFSFLDGGSMPEQLVARALEVGLPALAITDVNGLYGIVDAREALLRLLQLGPKGEHESRLKLLYGSELHFDDDVAVALVRDRAGYGNLCATVSAGRLAAEKGEFHLGQKMLLERSGGLWLLAGGPRSAVVRALREGNPRQAERRLSALREAFGERLLLELVRHEAPGDLERSQAMADIGRRLGISCVATNDVHFHVRERKDFHDILRSVKHGVTLAEAGRRLLPNAEPHLKSPRRMHALFADFPEACARAAEIAREVTFRLCDVDYLYPLPELPDGVKDSDAYLTQACRKGLSARLGEGAKRYAPKLEEELRLVRELQYSGYFLSMWEVVKTCADKGILCQGRGSAANSLICYSLGITSVRPDQIQMLFERFISKERNEPPDIDLDIEHERREEIIQYVYGRFGIHHAGMVAETIRYQWRSAMRDVGKALGFSEPQLLRVAKFLSHHWEELTPDTLRSAGLDPESRTVKQLLSYTQAMVGLPRHLSIHVGGFILSREPLSELVPIENGRMADRTVIQWNKDDVESMRMFKLDLLGLGMLTVLRKAFALIQDTRGITYGLQTVPADDAPTYAMLQAADTIGVFQVESRAQMNMLARLKPKDFYDLVIEVAIVRPGPIEGKMVHPFLKRRRGLEPITYPHPKLEPILARTLGVPLFQEQVMSLAVAVGGYTAGQADQLRRDMASWGSAGKIQQHREKLLLGMRNNGLDPEYAERVFQQIEGFGSYGFPESHAAAFAHLAYVSAYLKCHHPVEFACALINSQPMGFYSPAVIVADLKRHGFEVRPSNVQRSDWDCSIEDGMLRLGLRLVKGLGEEAGRAIMKARAEGGPFESLESMAHRTRVPTRALVPLAASGALREMHTRRAALWKAAAVARPLGELFSGVALPNVAEVPSMDELERLTLDIEYARAFTGRHPMELARPELEGVVTAEALKRAEPHCQVRVAGLVITRQRPETAHGAVFMTLEDETGHTDVSFSKETFRRFQDVIRLSSVLIVEGKVLADGIARSVSASRVMPLSLKVGKFAARDFH